MGRTCCWTWMSWWIRTRRIFARCRTTRRAKCSALRFRSCSFRSVCFGMSVCSVSRSMVYREESIPVNCNVPWSASGVVIGNTCGLCSAKSFPCFCFASPLFHRMKWNVKDAISRERNSFPTHPVMFGDVCAAIVPAACIAMTTSGSVDAGYAPRGSDLHDGD